MRAWSKYTGCWMLALGLACLAPAQRPEPNAFLNKPAHSVGELVKQVSSDPVVMDRFMRHYAMTRQQVIDMLSGLHLARMKKDTPMTVYNVNDDGVIGSKVFMIKAGALVFVDQYDTPILKKTCANPFFGKFPLNVPVVETEPVVGPLKHSDEGPTDFMPVAELVEPPFDPVPPAPEPPTPRLPLPGTEDQFSNRSRGSNLWPLLLLGAFFIDGGGDCPPETPIPGPAAALAFAGPAGIAMLRRRKKARNEAR